MTVIGARSSFLELGEHAPIRFFIRPAISRKSRRNC